MLSHSVLINSSSVLNTPEFCAPARLRDRVPEMRPSQGMVILTDGLSHVARLTPGMEKSRLLCFLPFDKKLHFQTFFSFNQFSVYIYAVKVLM